MKFKDKPCVVSLEEGIGGLPRNERHLAQYPLIMKYLNNVLDGENSAEYFLREGTHRIALYAVTEFTELFIKEIEKDGRVEIVAVGDRNYSGFGKGYRGYPVKSIQQIKSMYQKKEFDKILICSLFRENEIFRDLMNEGIAADDLVSVGMVLFFNE